MHLTQTQIFLRPIRWQSPRGDNPIDKWSKQLWAYSYLAKCVRYTQDPTDDWQDQGVISQVQSDHVAYL
jgi:hypothetical protein